MIAPLFPPRLSRQVAIVGGGISGLVAAYRLLQQGIGATIFEESSAIGETGETFEHQNTLIEEFPQLLHGQEASLLALLEELDLSGSIRWQMTQSALDVNNVCHPMNTALDLVCFGPLTLAERLRTAAGLAYIARGRKQAEVLDAVSASTWLKKIFGSSVFVKLWQPLLRAKFGEQHASVPALWVWNFLIEGGNGARSRKGYMGGGYRAIASALSARIAALGGHVLVNCSVERLQDLGNSVMVSVNGRSLRFDAAISTISLLQLQRIAQGTLPLDSNFAELPYTSVVTVLLVLQRSLQPYYWSAISKEGVPFQSLTETTHVVPLNETNGSHLVYLQNHCLRESDAYQRGDPDWEFQGWKALTTLYPNFNPSWVKELRVFRKPCVEPLWAVNSLAASPAQRVGEGSVYLAVANQAYPRELSWDTRIAVASKTAAAVEKDLANRGQGRGSANRWATEQDQHRLDVCALDA